MVNLTKCTVKFPQNRDLTANVLIDGYDKDKKCLELRQIESVMSADELSALITKFNITGVPEIFYWGKKPVLMERKQNDDSYETKFVYLNGVNEWESKTYNTFSSDAQMIFSEALYYVKDGAVFYRGSTIGMLGKINDNFTSDDAKLPWKYCACINGVHIAINNKDLFMGTQMSKITKYSHPEWPTNFSSMYYMNGKYFLVAADASQSTDIYYTEDLQTVVTVIDGQKPDFYLSGYYYKVAHTTKSFTVKKSTDLVNWEVVHEEAPFLMGNIQEMKACYNGNHLYVGLKVDFMGMMTFVQMFRSTDFEVWEAITIEKDHVASPTYDLGAASKWTLSAIEDGHLFNGRIIKDAALLHIYDNSVPSYLFGKIDRLYVDDEDVSDRVAILLGCKE